MRLKCEYKINKLPVANRMLFVSLIKEALKKSNKSYYENLYYYGDKNNKKMKSFCFAILLKDFEIQGDIINIKDKVILNISTGDYEFGINIYNALLNMNSYTYKSQYTLNRIRISLVREKAITEEEVVLKTMSPICIKDKHNNFLSPEDTNYQKELNYVVDNQLKSLRGYGLKKPLIFEKVLMKKVVVKEEIRDFKAVANKDIFYVNAYKGIFKLIGDIEDLNLIYQSGVGFRRAQAFGMIDLV